MAHHRDAFTVDDYRLIFPEWQLALNQKGGHVPPSSSAAPAAYF